MTIKIAHNIPFFMTKSIEELLQKNPNWQSVLSHIHSQLPQIKKTPRINYFSVWTVENDDAGQSRIFCQEDTGCVHKFTMIFPFKLPQQKLYLCLNELDGYTLMLPSDY